MMMSVAQGAHNTMRRLGSKMPPAVLRLLQNRFVYQPVIRQKGLSLENPPLFDTVFFEVRTRCNGHCTFCAAAVETDIRPDVSMPAALHDKVLLELAATGFLGRVAYHNNSEPLLFRELPAFVARARELLPASYIQILSNGRSLTLDKAEALIKAGINELSINYYNDDFTRELPKVFHDVANVVLPKFFRADQVHITGIGEDRQNPAARFRYQLTRRLENEKLDSRAGTAPNKRTPETGTRGFCQFPWTQMIVSADGRLPMCCADLNISESVGNASHQTVLEIWRGAPLQRIRRALWNGERESISTCRQCDFYGVKKAPRTRIGRLVYAMTRRGTAVLEPRR